LVHALFETSFLSQFGLPRERQKILILPSPPSSSIGKFRLKEKAPRLTAGSQIF